MTITLILAAIVIWALAYKLSQASEREARRKFYKGDL